LSRKLITKEQTFQRQYKSKRATAVKHTLQISFLDEHNQIHFSFSGRAKCRY